MSFSTFSLPVTERYFNKLVFTYLNQNLQVNHLYDYYPNLEGFQQALKEISNYTYERNILSSVLLKQALSDTNTSQKSIDNIHSIVNENTFTITTGHQLCLFTGPLYVIYKISAIIQLAKYLKQYFPQYHFVPVFWMNSEDHDINEINHFYDGYKKYLWNVHTDRTPVFLMNTNGLDEVYEQMKESNTFSEQVLTLFENAYLKHSSYTQATRYLINELFGYEGIVIIEPNEQAFKEKFKSYFHKDIFENATYQNIQSSIKFLNDNHYPIQVTPQKINTFLFHDNKRLLIQQDNDVFYLKGTNIKWSRVELEKHLDTHPEKFSPNVLLRPLYQQKILPNTAYIGGNAEVSYWLELKNIFSVFNVFYPIIIQRPVLFISPKNVQRKIEKLQLSFSKIFENNKHTLIKQMMDEQHLSIHLKKYQNEFLNIFDKLLYETEQIDKTLIAYLNAEKTKTIKFIENLEQKLNRTIKQKNETLLKQIDDIYYTFFPDDKMQERVWNISYVAKILNKDSLSELIHDLIPYCTINLSNNFDIKILMDE